MVGGKVAAFRELRFFCSSTSHIDSSGFVICYRMKMVGFPTLPILKRRRVLGAFFERQENLWSRSPILSINFMLNAREKSQVFCWMVFVRYKVRLIQFFSFCSTRCI